MATFQITQTGFELQLCVGFRVLAVAGMAEVIPPPALLQVTPSAEPLRLPLLPCSSPSSPLTPPLSSVSTNRRSNRSKTGLTGQPALGQSRVSGLPPLPPHSLTPHSLPHIPLPHSSLLAGLPAEITNRVDNKSLYKQIQLVSSSCSHRCGAGATAVAARTTCGAAVRMRAGRRSWALRRRGFGT